MNTWTVPSTETSLKIDPDMKGGQPVRLASMDSILRGDFAGDGEVGDSENASKS